MNKVPLTWLQAFEAAGRQGSFKAAAEELNVSPSNISHQIRDLEAYLGVLLFSRTGRSVELTDEGESFLPALTAGFQAIRQAQPQMQVATPHLHVGAFPFLANEIIAPRMGELKSRLPGVDIRLFTQTHLQSLIHTSASERLDVVVRYGPEHGRVPGFKTTRLGEVALVPVVGTGVPLPSSAEALLELPLIRVIGPFQGWQLWRSEFAPDRAQDDKHDTAFALETDSFHAAMLAVERGEGACLAVLPFLNPWIKTGRVQMVSGLRLAIEDQAAFVVRAPHQNDSPHITEFTDWLMSLLV